VETTSLNFREIPADEMRARAEAFAAGMATRRSVRDFSSRPVPRALIETALRTAGSAPSGANLQPWHFAVIGDPVIKQRVRLAAEAEERDFYAHRAPSAWLEALAPLGTDATKPFLETAPWLVAVFVVNSYQNAKGETHPTYYAKESTGLACGFLIAALHQAGLATLTHTPSPMGFLNEVCGRPANEKPFLLLVTGYPAEHAQVPVHATRRKGLGEISSFH
jgi:iodotyrosine deiodinase